MSIDQANKLRAGYGHLFKESGSLTKLRREEVAVGDDEREREKQVLRANIARLKEKQRSLKALSAGLDPDSRQAQEYINQLAGLEGEIASNEQNLRRL